MIIKRKLRLCFLLTLALLAVGAMIAGETFAAAWYNEDWSYRRQITIDHTKVQDVADPSATYAGFPLLVFATGLSNINANGTDIRFTDSDGTTELPREIESYSGGTLYAWVKVITLTKDSSDSTDDVIYMYYGNPSATEPAPSSTYGSENVWDSNFIMVQHLEEAVTDEGSSANAHIDSTSNDNHGDQEGNDDITGKIYNGQDFDGTDDYVDVGDVFTTAQTEFTVTGWVYVRSLYQPADDSFVSLPFVAFDDTALKQGFGLGAWHWIDFTDAWRMYVNDGTSIFQVRTDILSDAAFNAAYLNKWLFIAGTFKATDHMRIYIDGTIEAEKTTGVPSQMLPETTTNGWMGRASYFAFSEYSDAIIDEVRISNTARSADWIKTSYNNQNDPNFLSVSEQVSIPTMTEWGMIIFAVLAGLGAIYYIRRKRIES